MVTNAANPYSANQDSRGVNLALRSGRDPNYLCEALVLQQKPAVDVIMNLRVAAYRQHGRDDPYEGPGWSTMEHFTSHFDFFQFEFVSNNPKVGALAAWALASFAVTHSISDPWGHASKTLAHMSKEFRMSRECHPMRAVAVPLMNAAIDPDLDVRIVALTVIEELLSSTAMEPPQSLLVAVVQGSSRLPPLNSHYKGTLQALSESLFKVVAERWPYILNSDFFRKVFEAGDGTYGGFARENANLSKLLIGKANAGGTFAK